MSDIPRLIFDGCDALAHLRKTERGAPLHMRPEHDAASIAAWLRDRHDELTGYERLRAQEALGQLEKMLASIKTRQHARHGELRAVE